MEPTIEQLIDRLAEASTGHQLVALQVYSEVRPELLPRDALWQGLLEAGVMEVEAAQ